MAALARANERALLNEIGKVASSGRRRCSGDRRIIPRAQAAFEAIRPLAQHSQQCFLHDKCDRYKPRVPMPEVVRAGAGC